MRKKNTDKTIEVRFHLPSFLIFLFILTLEICIALFVDDKLIRPYGGDFLVILLMYYFLKTFVRTKTIYLVCNILVFAYTIEFCQLYGLVTALGLQNNKLMSTIIGTSFSWGDLVAYTLGGISCYFIEEKLVSAKKLLPIK